MFHPLFQLLRERPELLAEHAGAYADLAGAQASEAWRNLRRKLAWGLAAGVMAGLALALAGVALLLLAHTPLAQWQMPWLLAAVPGVPALLAALCTWQALRQPLRFELRRMLQQQWAADAALLSEVNQA